MDLILTAANARVKVALSIIFFWQLVQQTVELENMVNSILMGNLFVMIAKLPVVIAFLLHLV